MCASTNVTGKLAGRIGAAEADRGGAPTALTSTLAEPIAVATVRPSEATATTSTPATPGRSSFHSTATPGRPGSTMLQIAVVVG